MIEMRSPLPRPIDAIAADIERQFARGQLLVIPPREFQRLVVAAREGDPDALRVATMELSKPEKVHAPAA